MKIKILLFFAISITTSSFAQVNPTFGIRAGITSAGMRGDAINNVKQLLDFSNGMITTSNRTGLYAGGYTNIPLGEVMSIEPGLYYSQKGYEIKGALNYKALDLLGIGAKVQLQSQYIDLPILMKADLNGFQLFAGPQLSYLLQSNLRTTAGVLGFNLLDKKMDASNYFNKWDAGVTAGIGYQLASGLNLTASYDHGLTKVDENRNLSSYNKVVKVGLGYRF